MSGITDKLAFVEKPTSVAARNYTHSCLPVNGSTFKAGEIVRVDVPCGQFGTYLDTQNSYAKFTINNLSNVTTTGTNATTTSHEIEIDGTGYSFIDRQQVLYSGYTLEDITDYGLLASILLDNNTDMESRMTYWNMLAGAHPHAFYAETCRQGDKIEGDGSLTVYLPLVGSVVGQNIDKYLPIGQMTASDSLRVEWTLAQAGVPILAAGDTDTGEFSISNVEIVASIVKLSDDAEGMVRKASGGVYRIHGDSYRSYNQTLNAGVNNSTINIPAKVSSLKTLLIAHRYQNSISARSSASVTNRTQADLKEYYFQVGSTRLPQKPIRCDDKHCAEAQVELQKSLHQFGKRGLALAYVSSQWTESAVDLTKNGAFAIGMDCEAFSGKGDVLNQGISTISQPLFFNGVYDSLKEACVVTTFAHFDQIIEIDSQTGMAKVMF
mgnify:CR=1 FL=1